MKHMTSRRGFMKRSMAMSALLAGHAGLSRAQDDTGAAAVANITLPGQELTQGTVAGMSVSRLLLGGNLLTHFTHSRDLKYVYNLAAHYNTHEKILETLEIAQQNGVNTVVIHTVPSVELIRRHHRDRGGKMQWIICPTAAPDSQWDAYVKQVEDLINDGVESIYLWGVTADRLVAEGKLDVLVKAVELVKEHGAPSGVGAHDLRVIEECEQKQVPADFYIKTFHHHNYPTGPKPDDLTDSIREVPGYWCREPDKTIEVMSAVEKPWIAFKVMAAGAIEPRDAFSYAFENGADHVLAGMFDFEIADDVTIARSVLSGLERTRPWRS